MSKNPVVHFEMPYTNGARAAKFYTDVFGWEMNELGADMAGYITAGTADTDENHMVKTPGTINGGLYDQSKSEVTAPSFVISVADINVAMENIKSAGGEILGHPVDIPGIGAYVSFKDSEGNRVSILQPIL